MNKILLTLAAVIMTCAAANATVTTSTANTASTTEQSRGVVFRQTQSVYNSEIKEWIYFYSNGKVAVCSEASGSRYEGTYTMNDNRSGVTLYLPNTDPVYCRITLSRTGQLTRLTYRGAVYFPR